MFDSVIFLGDLNYRIDMGNSGTNAEFRRVEAMVRGGLWKELSENDQLLREIQNGRVFFSFQEALSLGHFPPTYRMNKNAQGYSNKKDQNPSFTDRVLFRGHQLQPLHYGTCHELNCLPEIVLKCSDHRPVFASFLMHQPIRTTNVFHNQGSKAILTNDATIWFNEVGFKPWLAPNENAPNNNNNNNAIDRRKSRLSNLQGFQSASSMDPASSDPHNELDQTTVASGSFGEEFEIRVHFKLSALHPTESVPFDKQGSLELRSFLPPESLPEAIPMKFAIYTTKPKRKLVGFARFPVPPASGLEEPFEVAVGLRGSKVGHICGKIRVSNLGGA